MRTGRLTKFLRLREPPSLKLCLPRFTGGTLAAGGLTYSGFVYADRDVRSAHHIRDLARRAGAATDFISPDDAIAALTQHDRSQTLVIFGSRSNDALPTVMTESRLRDLVTFSFGDVWTIRTRDGKTFSLKDPSKLDREAYTAATDYGVVAGLLDEGEPPLFVVAGLGGRATEGCGRYLRYKWTDLAARSKGKSFAALLRFPPPVNPEHCELAEFIRLD